MSRWSKRSEEEKERIKREQDELRKPKAERLQEKFQRDVTEILMNHEIPLRCKQCGFTTSEYYTLAMMRNPLTGNPTQIAFGECVKCGRTAKKVIEVGIMGLDMSITIAQICHLLKTKGRLIDDRKGEIRDWR